MSDLNSFLFILIVLFKCNFPTLLGIDKINLTSFAPPCCSCNIYKGYIGFLKKLETAALICFILNNRATSLFVSNLNYLYIYLQIQFLSFKPFRNVFIE